MNGSSKPASSISTLGISLNPVMIPTNMESYKDVSDKLEELHQPYRPLTDKSKAVEPLKTKNVSF